MDEILGDAADRYGVVIEEITLHQRFAVNDQHVFASASVYKLCVATQVLREVDAGHLRLTDPLTIEDEDMLEPEPDGGLELGETVSLEEGLSAMLSVSSNVAGHALLRLLGRASYNEAIASLGLTQTRVPVDGQDGLAVTTAADISHLLRLIATGQVLSEASRAMLYEMLSEPSEPQPVEASLPEDAVVIAKAGNLDRASNVAALVFVGAHTFSLAVFDEDVDPGDARLVIGGLARSTYDAYALGGG